MLIGIDASRANREHKTGTEWYSYYLIRWLAKLDSENQYILYTNSPLKGGLEDLTCEQYECELKTENNEVKYDKKGFQILKSPHNNFKAKILKWPFKFLWTQGGLSLEMIFKKPDVLFIPSHTLPIVHPKNSIVTIHDIGFEKNQQLYGHDLIGPKNKRIKKIINFIVRAATLGKCSSNTMDYHIWSARFALKHAKKIITVSNFSKNELIKIYNSDDGELLDSKIKVIHNGYNRYLYKETEHANKVDEVLRKYDLEKPYILYIGRLEKKKNTPALIEAFSIARENNKNINHKLVLVGDASYGYDEVKYQIQQYLLEDEVVMPGWIEERDMPYIYSGATAFVFPSLYEGFGIPVVQAMACGVPVIASNATSIPEVTGDAAILFNPKDVSSMAEAIEDIATNDDLRRKLIEKGRIQVKNFSWEKCARETWEVIKNIKNNNN